MSIYDKHDTAFKLLIGSGQGRGTWIIVRKSDDASTLRNTGGEGQALYDKYARTYRDRGASAFNALCVWETYTK